jgi:predicted HTH transcriptional regulator
MTKTIVLKALKSGRQFTAGQLSGLTRGSAETAEKAIATLRSEGYAIYTNQTKNGKTAYRLGTPSREMVAAAYRAAGARVFA